MIPWLPLALALRSCERHGVHAAALALYGVHRAADVCASRAAHRAMGRGDVVEMTRVPTCGGGR